MALKPGSRLGAFEIETLIGAGGMGEVYRARDTRLGRGVAVKVLPDALANDPDRTARFEREAKLLASLNHANIAQLHGLEQAEGSLFLIMELVEGATLAERIQRGAIPAEEAFEVAHQIAEAVEAAHEKGIIHRDLKPANVKLTPGGKVKVLDFGLAKALEQAAPAVNTMSPTLSVIATNAGVILGTAGYMSPEQARGHAADQRSDVFSFGCVLYEMLTGRQPFHGETVTDVIASVVARDVDWRAIPADLHPKVEEVIRRSLAKNPKDRWHAIGDLRVELEAIMADPHGRKLAAVHEPARLPIWRRAIPYAATALVVAMAAATATVVVVNRRAAAPPTVARFAVVLPADHRFVNTARHFIAISPDGTNMVYAANQQLYLRGIGDLEPRPIQGTSQNASRPVFSPDGRWIAYVARTERKLKKIAITGGAAMTIGDIPDQNGFGLVWNADNYIYLGETKQITRISANGGTAERIIALDPDEIAHRPQLLPDGDTLLFTLEKGGANRWDSAQIVAQSMKSGKRTVLISGGSDGRYVPTGHLVYALGATILAVPFDVKTLRTGGPVPVIEGVRRSTSIGGGADAQFAFADTGTLVYVPGGQAPANELSLVVVDRAGGRKPLNVPAGPYRAPRVSPDGKRLAVATDDGVVWIADLNDAAPIHKLTFEGHNLRPLWTRDGQRVVFASDREGDQALFWQRVDGGPAERVAKIALGVAPEPDGWSPDGKLLFFTNRTAGTARAAGGAAGISVLALGGDTKPTLVVKPPTTNSSVSPDGRWLAYMSAEAGIRPEVYVEPIPPTGEKHQITTNGGVNPLWSPDLKQLFFVTAGPVGNLMAIDIQTEHGFQFGKTTALPIEGIVSRLGPRHYDITPDGKRFVVLFPKAQTTADKAPAEQINVTMNWFEELKQRVPVGR